MLVNSNGESMLEHRPGDFGPIEDSNEVLDKLKSMITDGDYPHAVHFGTEQELRDKQVAIRAVLDEKPLRDEIDDLKKKMDSLVPIRSTHLVIPDKDEIEKFSGDK